MRSVPKLPRAAHLYKHKEGTGEVTQSQLCFTLQLPISSLGMLLPPQSSSIPSSPLTAAPSLPHSTRARRHPYPYTNAPTFQGRIRVPLALGGAHPPADSQG